MNKISKNRCWRLKKVLGIVFSLNIGSTTVAQVSEVPGFTGEVCLPSASTPAGSASLGFLALQHQARAYLLEDGGESISMGLRDVVAPSKSNGENKFFPYKSHESSDLPFSFDINANDVGLYISGPGLELTPATDTHCYPIALFQDVTSENTTWFCKSSNANGVTHLNLSTSSDFQIEVQEGQKVCINLHGHFNENENSWMPESYETARTDEINLNEQAWKGRNTERQAEQLKAMSYKISYQGSKRNSGLLIASFKKINGFSEQDNEQNREVLNIIREGERAQQHNNAQDHRICLTQLPAQYGKRIEILSLVNGKSEGQGERNNQTTSEDRSNSTDDQGGGWKRVTRKKQSGYRKFHSPSEPTGRKTKTGKKIFKSAVSVVSGKGEGNEKGCAKASPAVENNLTSNQTDLQEEWKLVMHKGKMGESKDTESGMSIDIEKELILISVDILKKIPQSFYLEISMNWCKDSSHYCEFINLVSYPKRQISKYDKNLLVSTLKRLIQYEDYINSAFAYILLINKHSPMFLLNFHSFYPKAMKKIMMKSCVDDNVVCNVMYNYFCEQISNPETDNLGWKKMMLVDQAVLFLNIIKISKAKDRVDILTKLMKEDGLVSLTVVKGWVDEMSNNINIVIKKATPIVVNSIFSWIFTGAQFQCSGLSNPRIIDFLLNIKKEIKKYLKELECEKDYIFISNEAKKDMIRGEISLLGTTVKTLNHLSGIDYVIELLNEVIVSEWQDNEIKEFKIGVVKKKLATQIYTYMYNERNSESFELDDKDARLLIEYADECFSEIKEKEGMEIKSTDLYNNPFSKHSIIMLGSMGLMVKCKSSEFPAKTARIYCDQIFKDLDELSKKLNDSNEQFIKETIVLEKVKWHFLLQQDEEGGRVLKEYKFEFHELRYRKAVLLSRFSLFDDAVKECEELIKLLDGGNASIKNAKYLNKKTEIFLAITKWDQYESEGGLNTELLVQAFLKLTKILRADTTGTNYITIIGHLKHVAESMKKADMDFSSYINFFPSPHNQYTNWIDLCRGLNIEHKDKEDTISKDNIVKMLKLRPDRKPCKIKSYCEIK